MDKPTDKMPLEVGPKIKDYMARYGIYQTHIARKLGIGKGTLHAKLTGKTHFTTAQLVIICDELRTPPGTFFYEKEKE